MIFHEVPLKPAFWGHFDSVLLNRCNNQYSVYYYLVLHKKKKWRIVILSRIALEKEKNTVPSGAFFSA